MKKSRLLFLLWGLIFGAALLCPEQVRAQASSVKIESYNDDSFARVVSEMTQETTGASARSSSVDVNGYNLKRLIVKVKDGNVDLTSYKATRIIRNQNNIYVMQFSSAADTKAAKTAISKLSAVEYVQTDSVIRVQSSVSGVTQSASTATGSSSSLSWGTSYIGADSYADGVKKSNSSASIKVAVVDTGVYSSHSYLSGRIASGGYDYVQNDSSPTDLNGHGTHVSGIIVDATPGLNVKILPVRVLDANGEGFGINIANGISYAVKKGAKVINLSLNVDDGVHDYYLHDVIEDAVKAGVTVVVSAGNASSSVANSCPADLTDVIVVGAIDQNGIRAYFSNYGQKLDVVAPGVDILSTYLKNQYIYMDGTSMAAPHISALAAMLKMMNPSYTPAKIEYVLKQKCRDLGVTGWDKYYAHGVPDLSTIKIYPATSISLNKTSASVTACQTVSLTATVKPTNATVKTITWSSSNTNVATVSNGMVIAKAAGTATITAKTANGKKATCTITVKQAPMMPRTSFRMYSYNPTTQKCAVKITTFKSSTGTQVQLQNENKQTIATKTGAGNSTVYFTNLSSQKIYYYRARTYYDINSTRVYGTWSCRRVFSTAKVTVSKVSGGKAVSVKIPNVVGVKKFNVWISTTSSTSGFKKVGAVLPGKSLYLSIINGSAFDSYNTGQKFYVYLVPDLVRDGMLDEVFVKTTFTR